MGIVFAVLALLAVSIKVLNLFDRNPAVVSQAAGSELSPEIPSSAGEITGQQVAAIGLALGLSSHYERTLDEVQAVEAMFPEDLKSNKLGGMAHVGDGEICIQKYLNKTLQDYFGKIFFFPFINYGKF